MDEANSFFVDYIVLLGLHHEKGNVLEWTFPDVRLPLKLLSAASSHCDHRRCRHNRKIMSVGET